MPSRGLDPEFLKTAIPWLAAIPGCVLESVPTEALRADSTEKFLVRNGREERFLIVSSAAAPYAAGRGAARQREVRALLPAAAGEVMEPPIEEGIVDGRSYAIYTRHRALSRYRLLNMAQLALLAPQVFRWLRLVAAQATARPDIAPLIVNLRRLQSVADLPPDMYRAAEAACDAFAAGRIRSVQVVQHGDLWPGNILRAPNAHGFVLIDWGGARTDGEPFCDLVNFACSVSASHSTLRRQIDAHARVIGCASEHAVPFVLSGLGALYAALEHFPEESFVALCRSKFEALRRTGLTAGP